MFKLVRFKALSLRFILYCLGSSPKKIEKEYKKKFKERNKEWSTMPC